MTRTPLIETYDERAYLANLGESKESVECFVHLAQVFTSRGTITAYVKFYPDDKGPSKGLCNEACGYLIAKSLGLPVPESAVILALPAPRLVEAHPSLGQRLRVDDKKLVWATEQVRGLTVQPKSGEGLEELRRWEHLPAVLAFDDWALNADRHTGNLLRRSRRRFVLIDHGHLGGGLYWDADLLAPQSQYQSPLARELWGSPIPPDPDIRNATLGATTAHLSAFETVEQELTDLTSTLLTELDHRAFTTFLRDRAQHGYERVRTTLGLLL